MNDKPGHEYTKANAKFLVTVLQTEPVKKLQEFAENNKETQGKFTIGDEKVSSAGLMSILTQSLRSVSNTMSSCASK